MGNEVVPSRGTRGRSGRREDAVLLQELGQLERTTTYGVAQIEAQAELDATRVMAVAHVGQQAMQAVAVVSQVELHLARAMPHAAHRFVGIAEATSLTLEHMVYASARRINK